MLSSIFNKIKNKLLSYKNRKRSRTYNIVFDTDIMTVHADPEESDNGTSPPPPSPVITRRLFNIDVDETIIKNDYDLIIIGYESTAIYELLAYKKIPFLILISKKYFNYLNKESQKDFLILFKKKILFFSEKKLAGEINRNYYKIISIYFIRHRLIINIFLYIKYFIFLMLYI